MCYATRVDVELACGSDQLCGGVKSGIEGVIHAMTNLFCNMVLLLVGVCYSWMHLLLLIALTVLHSCRTYVYFGLVVLGLLSILNKAGQHWF